MWSKRGLLQWAGDGHAAAHAEGALRTLQGFVKQVLEVADNLERAAEAVPQAALTSSDAAELQKQLTMLLEGVQMTQRVLNQVRP